MDDLLRLESGMYFSTSWYKEGSLRAMTCYPSPRRLSENG